MTQPHFFEADGEVNPCVIMAPAGVGPRWHMALLSQGSAEDVGYQVGGRTEAYRVLLRKRVVCAGPVPHTAVAMAETFTLAAGVHVVIVPLPERGPSAFMQDVTMPVVTGSLEEALGAARALGCLALVCEILHVAQADVPQTAWIRSDGGVVTFPPMGRVPAASDTTPR